MRKSYSIKPTLVPVFLRVESLEVYNNLFQNFIFCQNLIKVAQILMVVQKLFSLSFIAQSIVKKNQKNLNNLF